MFDFGENLKILRTNKKMTQKRLASMLNISEAMICRYEKGELYPQYDTLCSLSSIFNISLDELCGRQSSVTVSLYGLTDEQISIIKELVNTFRNNENDFKKNISERKYTLLGKIAVEFSK